jgi:hypothetical protein
LDARRFSARTVGYQSLAVVMDKAKSAVVAVQRRHEQLPSMSTVVRVVGEIAVRLEWWAIVLVAVTLGYVAIESLYQLSGIFTPIVAIVDMLRVPLGLMNLERIVADAREKRVDNLALTAALVLAGSIFQKCSERTRMTFSDRASSMINGSRQMLMWGVLVSTTISVLLQNRFPVGSDGRTLMRANELAVRVADQGSFLQAQNLVQAGLAGQAGDFRGFAENIGDYWMAGGRMSAISPDYVEFEGTSNVWGPLPDDAMIPETPGQKMLESFSLRPPTDGDMDVFRDSASQAISSWITWDEYAVLARDQSLLPPDIRVRFTSFDPSPLAQRYARALSAENEQQLLEMELDATVGEAASSIVRQLPEAVQQTVVAGWTWTTFNQVSATTYSVETTYNLLSKHPYVVAAAGTAVASVATGGASLIVSAVGGMGWTMATGLTGVGIGLIGTNYLPRDGDTSLPSDETARRIQEGAVIVRP